MKEIASANLVMRKKFMSMSEIQTMMIENMIFWRVQRLRSKISMYKYCLDTDKENEIERYPVWFESTSFAQGTSLGKWLWGVDLIGWNTVKSKFKHHVVKTPPWSFHIDYSIHTKAKSLSTAWMTRWQRNTNRDTSTYINPTPYATHCQCHCLYCNWSFNTDTTCWRW